MTKNSLMMLLAVVCQLPVMIYQNEIIRPIGCFVAGIICGWAYLWLMRERP
jgi:hypothetical protein